jgi:hypothetical protein
VLESLSRVQEAKTAVGDIPGAVSQSEISGEDLEKYVSALEDNRRI